MRATEAIEGGRDRSVGYDNVVGSFDSDASALRAFAIRSGARLDDAPDIVQEAFARLLSECRAGKEIRDQRAWLFTTTYRLVVDQGRARDRVLRLLARIGRREAERSSSDAGDDPVEEVWAAVDKLPRQQRAAVYLRYRADFDFKTIAGILRVTESAARSYVSKALEHLQTMLPKTEGEE